VGLMLQLAGVQVVFVVGSVAEMVVTGLAPEWGSGQIREGLDPLVAEGLAGVLVVPLRLADFEDQVVDFVHPYQ